MLATLITLILAPQLTQDSSVTTPPDVRVLVSKATARNYEARPYRARTELETEIAVVARRASGRREVVSMQQQASTIEWTRDSVIEQHVTGYRAEQVGMELAMTRVYRAGWVVPVLQGDRIRLRFPNPASVSKVEKALDPVVRQIRRFLVEPETVATIHPLARDGPDYYEYPRVDSLRESMPNGDSVAVLRIAVRPRGDVSSGTSVFAGAVDIDARTLLVVRLRGRVFVIHHAAMQALDAITESERVVGFVDMWNGPERDSMRLPFIERLDIVRGGVVGQSATLLRFVTRFKQHDIIARDPPPPPDSAQRRSPQYRITYAPRDSQDAHGAWMLPMRRATEIAQTEPLDDLYPDRIKPTGPPRWSFRARNDYEVFRFNKVEGLYTGLSVSWLARDRVPGLSVVGTAGYAWSEETWRGYVGAGLRRHGWIMTAAVARLLDLTNDFRSPLDSGAVWSAIWWSADDYDYLERRVARLTAENLLTPIGIHVRLELGFVRDTSVAQHRTQGIFFGPFRPNRVVDPGRYVRSIALVEWNPDIHADLTRERFGGGVRYERADGDLDYQRVEGVFIARQNVRSLLFIERLYGGLVGGTVPTQQLFEIGSTQNLPGYDYKAFAGDRAWIARGTVQYAIPTLRSPIPIITGFVIPPLAPDLVVGVQTGMAWASNDQARDAVRRLGDKVDSNTGEVVIDLETGQPVPVSAPTEALRATASFGLRLLGGSVYLGVALPIDATHDTRRGLRFVYGFSRQL